MRLIFVPNNLRVLRLGLMLAKDETKMQRHDHACLKFKMCMLVIRSLTY